MRGKVKRGNITTIIRKTDRKCSEKGERKGIDSKGIKEEKREEGVQKGGEKR